MLKYALLAGAITFAAPALAQTTTAPAQPTPVTTGDTAPGASSSPATAQTTPTDATPMRSATAQAATTPAATAQAAAAQPAPTQQAATQPASGDQVAQVVDTEFAGYDKNSDGKLNTAEFGAWMVALKTKTDPSTKAGTPETKKWVDAAFAQADTDKSKSLSKTELTSFLSQG